MCGGRLGGSLARVALIDEGQLDRFACRLLHGFGQLRDLRPVLLVGRGDDERQQMPERVHGDVRLAPLAALRPVVSGAGARFRARLQRPAIKNGGRRTCVAPRRDPEQFAQVVNE
jgi:hypothetical protein